VAPALATPTRRRRRHAAQKSRAAALALSLASTGGLSAWFAAAGGAAGASTGAPAGIVASAPATTAALAMGAPVATAPATSAAGSGASANAAGSTAATPPASPATTLVNGATFQNKWGPVQVQVTFAPDGSLQSVDAIQTPYRDGKSVRINDRAVPVLDSEALQAQSANVHTVSGATYTSHDYARSLQSAIDAARAAGVTQLA
jgi:uncharacterized protein with FMN-binding domain